MSDVLKESIKFFMYVVNSTFSLAVPIAKILLSKNAIPIGKVNFVKKNKRCIVLGNGPSLKTDFELILSDSGSYDYCCVNNFVLSEYFVVLKPKMYIFLDNYFWAENAHEDWVKQREKTFHLLNDIVDWKMQVFIPIYANENFMLSRITNPHIELIKLKVAGLSTVGGRYAHMLFNTGYFGPGSMNVLIYAIYLSIQAKYESIDIYGADLSFHKDVEVNQKTNDLIIKHKHFYGKQEFEVLTKDPQKNDKFTMYEFMDITTKTFFAHEVLASYAKKLDIKILNKSNSSLIDAYPRV